MAISTIKMNQQTSRGTPTNKTGVTPTLNSVVSVGKIAFLRFAVNSVSLAGNNGVLCTLPESFIPQHDEKIMALTTYNDTNRMLPYLIKSNGDVVTAMGSGIVSEINILNIPYPLL